MAVPRSTEARLYYRCAFQRYEEADFLLRADFTTAAVYLAGYGVECVLKALILEASPATGRRKILRSFRGSKGHDYEWLRSVYFANGGARFPAEVAQHFTLVNDWSTDLRYMPRSFRANEAEAFLVSVLAVIRWADGRI